MAIERISEEAFEFQSPFLRTAFDAFQRRRKAINYHGKLELFTDREDAPASLTVCYSFANDPALEVRIDEDHRVSVCVRSNRRRHDGKILFRLDGLRFGRSGASIVRIVEYTIARIPGLECAIESDVKREIEGKWREACIRLA